MRRSISVILAAATLLVAAPGANATFPGDPGLIVFHDDTDEGTQLFTMTPSGEDVRQITELPPGPEGVGAAEPDWSPDGSRIVVGKACEIGVIDPDGSNLAVLSDEGDSGRHGIDLCEGDPSFTPDGRSIVFNRFDGRTETEEVWRVSIDGTDRNRVTDACGTDPNVSPDGTLLSCRGPNGALWVVNMDGTDAKQVSPTAVGDVSYKHDWAPDGSAILFTDGSDDASPDAINFATVAPDGTRMRYLSEVEHGAHAYAAGYSPDGTSIIYRVDRGDAYAVFIMAADGSAIRQVTEFGAFRPRYLDWGAAQAE